MWGTNFVGVEGTNFVGVGGTNNFVGVGGTTFVPRFEGGALRLVGGGGEEGEGYQ